MSYQPTILLYREAADYQHYGDAKISSDFFGEQDNASDMMDFSDLRSKVYINNKEGKYRFICADCGSPLKISGGANYGDRYVRYHFKHFGPVPDNCEYKEPHNYTKEEIARQIFHGRQEGHKHLFIKDLIHKYLTEEFGEGSSRIEERVKMGGRQWRRPDINVDTQFGNVAFEVQLAPISIDVITARNQAYRGNGGYIIWIFDEFIEEEFRFPKRDAGSQNLRNIFIFDEEAISKTEREHRLYLNVWYFENGWHHELLAFSDLTFDENRKLVYYKDLINEKSNSISEDTSASYVEPSSHVHSAYNWVQSQELGSIFYQNYDKDFVAIYASKLSDVLNEYNPLLKFLYCLEYVKTGNDMMNYVRDEPEKQRKIQNNISVAKWEALKRAREITHAIPLDIWEEFNITLIPEVFEDTKFMNVCYKLGFRMEGFEKHHQRLSVTYYLEDILEKEGSAPLPKEIKEKRFQRIDILILESLYGIESDDVAFEYAQKLESARGFLRCIFYIWTGINVTGLANLSATVNNLIDHFSKESKIVKWVIKNSPKEYKFSNFTSNKGKNRLSELNDYDNERPTSFLECLVKHMCNSGTLLSEAIASVGKLHDDDDYYD